MSKANKFLFNENAETIKCSVEGINNDLAQTNDLRDSIIGIKFLQENMIFFLDKKKVTINLCTK